jgi:hypothetical protein
VVYLAGVSEFVAILPAKVQSVEAVFLHRIEEIRLFGVILSRKSRKPSMGRPLDSTIGLIPQRRKIASSTGLGFVMKM